MQTKWGEYIVVEGTDGAGKTTAANNLAQIMTEERGRPIMRVDEPDSAYFFGEHNALEPISAEIRTTIKNGSLGRLALTNILLFNASRVQNWFGSMLPHLESGGDVIAARSSISTEVYQGIAEGSDVQEIRNLTLQLLGPRYAVPNHLFILDIEDEEERLKRISSRGPLENPDTFEMRNEDFQFQLRQGYRNYAKEFHIEPIISHGDPMEIARKMWNVIDTANAREISDWLMPTNE